MNDCIFPLLTDFVTNHVVIRGMFEKITVCVYGLPYSGTEGNLLIETAKNDVPLEKLQNRSEDFLAQGGDKISLTPDDIELLNNYTLESLISPYIKCEVMGGLKRAYYLKPPNVNMVEKTKMGYIYYENDLNYYSQCLYNFYLNETKSKGTLASSDNFQTLGKNPNLLENNLDEITFFTYFKKISEIIKILISKNSVFLDDQCIFRQENNEVFHKVPLHLIEIIVMALEGRYFGYSEIVSALKMLKFISNSSYLVNKFIEKNGLQMLYSLILNYEGGLPNFNFNSSQTSSESSILIKILVLENIYRLITHLNFFNKFMENIDKSKLQHQYFMVKESLKDSDQVLAFGEENKQASKKKEKKADREKEKDRDKKKSKKEKKSKKDKKRSSKSKSRSRSHSRERDASENSYSRKYKEKKHAKNVLLKNGYQIILTFLIEKKNPIIVNLTKKIIKKINFLICLKEIEKTVDILNKQKKNPEKLEKISLLLDKTLEYLYSYEVPYKKSFEKDEATGFSDEFPYRNFWSEYLKINRKFFKKSENQNIKSTIENQNFSGVMDYKVITNEISIILEEYHLFENILYLIVIIF
jgi:hypothetical protein